MRSFTRAGAVAVVAALALTGCGRGSSGDSTATGTTDVKAGKATGNITVWALGAEGEKMGAIAKGFETANPGTKVTVTVIPFDAAHDKIATAIAGSQTPDVSLVGTTWVSEFAGSKALDATPTKLIDKSKFFAGSWDTTSVNGTSYGVPWYVETRLIYYRKDLAAKAGVTEPKDWQGLKDFTKALQTKGGAKWGISLQPGGQGSWQTYMPFAWQKGAELTSGNKFTFASKPMQDALDYYASFFKEKISPTQLAQGALESGFIKGDIGSFVSGPWHMGILRDQGGAGFEGKWDVAEMPKEQAGTSFTGGGDLVVFKKSKNRDTAWKFVDYLTQEAQQQTLYALVGSLPSVQKAWDTGKLSTDPLLKKFGTQLQDAKSAPAIATWEQVAAELDDAVERVCLGKQDSAAALADADKKANAIGTGAGA
ncbi:MAG: multiple sugar transport system substrate-binding protein [Actinomycetota bacterium]|nr:multiple sugar transport system substrate-binding protein [Actinomycetota bacterium]